MRRSLPAIALVIGSVASACAQPGPPPSIPSDARFEVATIKPGVPGESHGIQFLVSFTRITTLNTSVADLMKYAYGLHGDQILGGMDKLMHEGYAISAVVNTDTPIKPNADLLKQMLRNLLADRFGLVFHQESRELPVYLLETAGPGVRLKPSEQELSMTTGAASPGVLVVHGGSPHDLAAYLQRFVTNRPVLDRTGISGRFDMELHFSPVDAPVHTDSTTPELPDLYTAIREQLGLRLTAAKAQTPVVVIDHVTAPTPN